MQTKRSLRRHLFAVCTFLVPLGVIAWIGATELQRQADQVRGSVDREGLQFLQAAARSLDERFDLFLPQVVAQSETLLQQSSPAGAARRLQAAGYASVLDIVLIAADGRLTYPTAGAQRLALPFHRDSFGFGRDDDRGGRDDDGSRELMRKVDLLVSHEKFTEAESLLASRSWDRGGRRRSNESSLANTGLWFRLATVQRKLGKTEESIESFQRVVDSAAYMRRDPRSFRSFDPRLDSETLSLALMSEVAIAEADATGEKRVSLLGLVANGERDQCSESILETVVDRLAHGVPEPLRAKAAEWRTEAQLHFHARAFAADYDRLLRETVLRRIRAEATEPADKDLRPVLTAGSPSTLLLLHQAPPELESRCAWIGIRLDAGQLLASALGPVLAGEGFFRLAIADSEDLPIIAAPAAPADYAPPALASHGMMLRAYPADMDRYLGEVEQGKRSAALLIGFLFLAASVGAAWTWRSVSRETELLRLKVDLLSRVSHELKTPLALISLYGETLSLKRARDPQQAAQFGQVITREAGRLATMVQRILDFSRRASGTLVYEPERGDLAATLARVAETYEPHLAQKGASLVTDLAAGVNAEVDHVALESVVLNLLENATKYGREDEESCGAIELRLCKNGDSAEIEVLDRGRGVPDSERDSIFESFYRASNAGEVRGAGLGLSLVRHFAQAHGGEAHALPREGGGTIFRITLPLARDPKA